MCCYRSLFSIVALRPWHFTR